MDRLEELYMKLNLPKALDILSYTPDEFAEMMKDNFFIKQVVKEGILIYPTHKKQLMEILTEKRCTEILNNAQELQKWIMKKL
jgi:hypothetical protein